MFLVISLILFLVIAGGQMESNPLKWNFYAQLTFGVLDAAFLIAISIACLEEKVKKVN